MGEWLDAAEKVLRTAGKELSYREISRIAIDEMNLMKKTKTDYNNINKQISQDIVRRGLESRFYTPKKRSGIFGLREFLKHNISEPVQNDESETINEKKYIKVCGALDIILNGPPGTAKPTLL